jgi:predicted RND superfamily exporter protein
MLLVIIAAALIVGITVLYLRSISIALIIVIGAALSLGVSYFIYRVIYRIPIFPYMNLMSAFILIGIGCDDIFVFFDTWDQEKTAWLKKYQDRQEADSKLICFCRFKYIVYLDADVPLNNTNTHEVLSSNQKIKPSKLKHPSSAFESRHRLCLINDSQEIQKVLMNEEALIEIMSKTLKHAASSMFVTSFTTSAAFFTNMLTNISFVQVFGVYTGTCILLYFFITVTAIAAFAVS